MSDLPTVVVKYPGPVRYQPTSGIEGPFTTVVSRLLRSMVSTRFLS